MLPSGLRVLAGRPCASAEKPPNSDAFRGGASSRPSVPRAQAATRKRARNSRSQQPRYRDLRPVPDSRRPCPVRKRLRRSPSPRRNRLPESNTRSPPACGLFHVSEKEEASHIPIVLRRRSMIAVFDLLSGFQQCGKASAGRSTSQVSQVPSGAVRGRRLTRPACLPAPELCTPRRTYRML